MGSFARGFPLCVGSTGGLLPSGGSTGAFLLSERSTGALLLDFWGSSGLLCGGSTGAFLGSCESDLAAGFLISLQFSG